MRQAIKQELYTSPKAEVIETNARQVICSSALTLGDLQEVDQTW